MRPALYFCWNTFLYHSGIAGFVAVDLILARIFGPGSIFFIYVNMFTLLFSLMHAIAVSNQCGLYAPLLLGFGATRRQLMLGYTVATVFSAVLTVLLSAGAGALTSLLIGPLATDTIQGAVGIGMAGSNGLLYMVMPMLGAGAAFSWTACLRGRHGWRAVLLCVLCIIAAVVAIVGPMLLLIFTGLENGGLTGLVGVLNWLLPAGGAVLFVVFYGLTMRELHRLTQ